MSVYEFHTHIGIAGSLMLSLASVIDTSFMTPTVHHILQLCFQDIGKPYQPLPTYAITPTSRATYQQDPTLCDRFPATSLEPLVVPFPTDLLCSNPLLAKPSYLGYAAIFPIATSNTHLDSPGTVLSIPLLVRSILTQTNPAGNSSLAYSPIPYACQSTMDLVS